MHLRHGGRRDGYWRKLCVLGVTVANSRIFGYELIPISEGHLWLKPTDSMQARKRE